MGPIPWVYGVSVKRLLGMSLVTIILATTACTAATITATPPTPTTAPTVTVPDPFGLRSTVAVQRLERAGLSSGGQRTVAHGAVSYTGPGPKPGCVVRQHPVAGTLVPVGTSVELMLL